jgi:glycine cleavage system H protein
MLPGVDGFRWSAGHLIFLGAFFSVATVIVSTTAYAVARVVKAFRSQKVESIRWKVDFEDLPAKARFCRHELTGEVLGRTCRNGFDCGNCETHQSSERSRQPEPVTRMYHRGHTWIRREPDGTFLVGLDELASKQIGQPEKIELPEVGTELRMNGTAARVVKSPAEVRILSPVAGEVIETGKTENDWLFRLKPAAPTETRHLLRGDEVSPWLLRETERLEPFAGDWERACTELFLEP